MKYLIFKIELVCNKNLIEVQQNVSFTLKNILEFNISTGNLLLESLNQINSCQKDQNWYYWLWSNELWNGWQSVYKSKLGMKIDQQTANIHEPFYFYDHCVFQWTVKDVCVSVQMFLGHYTKCVRSL